MKEKIKKYWLLSLLSFHCINVFAGFVIPLIDDLCSGWWGGYYFKDSHHLWSTLFLMPLLHGVLSYLAFHFVYQRENKYALRVVMILTLLFTYLAAYCLWGYAHHDWSFTQCPVAIMLQQAFWFYTSLCYFITSALWYRHINKTKCFLTILVCSIASLFLILVSNSIIYYLAWLVILGMCLPDFIQESILNLLFTILKDNNLIEKKKMEKKYE